MTVARPMVPAVAESWYDELAVTQPGDDTRGWALLILLGGMGAAFGPLHDIVRDSPDGPGWSRPMDPDRALVAELPWLAQFAGVSLTPGASETDQRAQITSPPAFERGTPDALVGAAQRSLTGLQRVTVTERYGSAYGVLVVTYAAETPDPARTERDVRTQKPAGYLLTFRVDAGWLISQMEAAYSTVGDVEAAFTSVANLESRI